MNKSSKTAACVLLALASGLSALAQTEAAGRTLPSRFTLQQCMDYALAHNVQLQKNRTTARSAEVDVTEAQAGLLPSLSAAVSQGLTYRPFQDTGSSYVNGGIATSAADKAMQSGSYGINAQWVVWNGGQIRRNIQLAECAAQSAAYDTQIMANSIQEEIAQYYIQILYMQEAYQVNRQLLQQDSVVCARGAEMVKVGSMARADLAQLEAQVSQGRYDLVNIETQIATAKMKLRQLLELPPSAHFDICDTDAAEAEVLRALPDLESVYVAALDSRPEVKRSELAIEQSKLNTQQARSGYSPTVSLTGSLGDSHITGSGRNFFSQMQNNFNAQVGVSVSIPILDNRKTKSAVERSQLAETTARLDLQDTRKQLYEMVETYWLNAVNSRAKFVAAQSNVRALEESYTLMNEQFTLGLKHIAELLNSRAGLLQAKQSLLQDKYTALLNRSLLSFYGGSNLQL